MGHRPSKEIAFLKPPLLYMMRFQVTLNNKLTWHWERYGNYYVRTSHHASAMKNPNPKEESS